MENMPEYPRRNPWGRFPSYSPPSGPYDDGSGAAWPQRPETYLVFAILVTFFCCLPLGIVGVVYASQVESRYNARDFAGAADASAKAKKFSIAGLIGGGLVVLIYVAIVIFAVAFDVSR